MLSSTRIRSRRPRATGRRRLTSTDSGHSLLVSRLGDLDRSRRFSQAREMTPPPRGQAPATSAPEPACDEVK